MIIRKCTLMGALLLAGGYAQANDLQINGFLNVTAGALDNKAIAGSPATQTYDTTVGMDVNTLAGIQFQKKVNDSTSATLQLVSRGQDGYSTEAAWAYVTFSPTDSTDIRFGRLRTPFFHYSEFLEVGYAYNWTTPPHIVYRLEDMSSYTGADIVQRFTLGKADGYLQAFFGRYKDDFYFNAEEYEMELHNAFGFSGLINYGDFGARAGYQQAKFFINGLVNDGTGTRFLDNAAYLLGNGGAGMAPIKDYVPQGDISAFTQASLFWDNGSTSVVAEYTWLRHDSHILVDDDAWLVTAAQRLGEYTVHLTYAQQDDKVKKGAPQIAQKFAEQKDSSTTLGVRWDYNTSTAFKVEASYITKEDASARMATSDPTAPLKYSSGTLFAIGMNLIF